jgi:hypothetical protein
MEHSVRYHTLTVTSTKYHLTQRSLYILVCNKIIWDVKCNIISIRGIVKHIFTRYAILENSSIATGIMLCLTVYMPVKAVTFTWLCVLMNIIAVYNTFILCRSVPRNARRLSVRINGEVP